MPVKRIRCPRECVRKIKVDIRIFRVGDVEAPEALDISWASLNNDEKTVNHIKSGWIAVG